MSDFLNDILEAINEISSEVNRSKNYHGNSTNRNPYPQNPSNRSNPPRPSYYTGQGRSGSNPGYSTTPRSQGNYGYGNTSGSNPGFKEVPKPQSVPEDIFEGSFGIEGNPPYDGSLGIEGISSFEGAPGLEGNPPYDGSLGLEGSSGFEGSPVNEGSGSKKKKASPKKSAATAVPKEKSILEKAVDFSNLSNEDILRGLIFSEILERPKFLRRYDRRIF
ncbi:MAG TPA: hypothetical protein PK033_01290 [Acetivibrio sp.]|jgi:hypothetical protein|nr:hypothetical protein [Acetivibrio sp.]HQA56501.1 hypothetical protein [Acetivibrio sp.]